MLEHRPKLYIGLAFTLGILLTLGYKDLYPDLERRFLARRRHNARKKQRLDQEESLIPSEDFHPDHVSLLDNSKIISSPSDQEWSHISSSLAQSSRYESISNGIEGTIGSTPLIRIKSLSEYTQCEILAKAEFLNGAGNSPKDRVALNMILTAERDGLLVPGRGDCIYEGTVGSTGISLAAIARARGYRAHICMPSDQSLEKSSLLLHLGAEVERVPPASIVDSNQFVNLAKRRASEHTADENKSGRGYFADQFENVANFTAHYKSTGPEIYSQCDGKLDAFVAGAGTGGTISGVAMYLIEKMGRKNVKIVLADPQGSGLYNKIKYGVMFSQTEKEGTRRRNQVDSIVEGIGVNRITANFEAGRELVDDAIKVSDQQAIGMARWLVEKDGLFVGSSSAVNCVAAVKLAQTLGPGHRIVTILCDSGTRHLSKFWKEAGVIGDKDDASLDEVLALDE